MFKSEQKFDPCIGCDHCYFLRYECDCIINWQSVF